MGCAGSKSGEDGDAPPLESEGVKAIGFDESQTSTMEMPRDPELDRGSDGMMARAGPPARRTHGRQSRGSRASSQSAADESRSSMAMPNDPELGRDAEGFVPKSAPPARRTHAHSRASRGSRASQDASANVISSITNLADEISSRLSRLTGSQPEDAAPGAAGLTNLSSIKETRVNL